MFDQIYSVRIFISIRFANCYSSPFYKLFYKIIMIVSQRPACKTIKLTNNETFWPKYKIFIKEIYSFKCTIQVRGYKYLGI